MPKTPPHIPTFLCSMSYFKFLVLYGANLSQTASYVSQHLIYFFLRFLSPFSQGSQSPTSWTCLHIETSSIRLEGLVPAGFMGVYLQHLQKTASPCGTVTGWCIYWTTPLLSLWDLVCEPQLSERSCWTYLSPIKRKTVSQSSEWHKTALPNYKTSYYRTTGFPPGSKDSSFFLY